MVDGAVGFLLEHSGAGAAGVQHHTRMTAPDIVFLHEAALLQGDADLTDHAETEWDNITTIWPTAGALDSTFRSINRASVWDLAFFLEAAALSQDDTWADAAAEIIADTEDPFYYDSGNTRYALNVSAAVRALVGQGYADQYQAEVLGLLEVLIGLIGAEDSIGGSVQETAYAVMAFKTVGASMNRYANRLARWLADRQEADGGWLEGGDEYAEIDGEAVQAMAMSIGRNVALRAVPKLPANEVATLHGERQGAQPF